MKIISVFGTRPEFIKLSRVFDLLEKNFEHKMIHTGQHYSPELDDAIFKDLKLKLPDYKLNTKSDNPAEQTAKIIFDCSKIFQNENPDLVLVQGDTNSTLGGAIAGAKLGIPVVHLEAGSRCFNKERPEEINRIIVDHIANILFASGKIEKKNLKKENLESIWIGSTTYDSVKRAEKIADKKYTQRKEEYAVLTSHRAETVDNPERLRNLIEGVDEISKKIKIIFPIHPHTKKSMKNFKLSFKNNVEIIEPVPYTEMVYLVKNAKLLLTDSGGLQEEGPILNTPTFALMYDIEWMYCVNAGKLIKTGWKKEDILSIVLPYLENPEKLQEVREKKLPVTKNASKKILKNLKEYFSNLKKN